MLFHFSNRDAVFIQMNTDVNHLQRNQHPDKLIRKRVYVRILKNNAEKRHHEQEDHKDHGKHTSSDSSSSFMF